MRKKLKEKRKSLGLTQKAFAAKLGISLVTYQFIEQGRAFPREKTMYKILELIKSDSLDVLENESNENGFNVKERGDISKNICDYMNSRSNKEYTVNHVKAIRSCLLLEYNDRKLNCIQIKSHTENGKQKIFERVATFVKEKYKLNVNAYDVKLYKECARDEFSDRTGKCTWSLPEVRKKFGYNPTNGYKKSR